MNGLARTAHPVLVLTTSLILASCNTSNSGDGSVVRVGQDPSNGQIETIAFDIKNTAKNMMANTESPDGLRASFRFAGNGTQFRLDLPAGMFPDQQARIMVYDQANRSARVLFKQNLQPDALVSDDQSNQLLTATLAQMMMYMNPKKPFAKMTLADFRLVTQRLNFDTTNITSNGATFKRSVSEGKNKRTQILNFDTAQGAVTSTSEVLITPTMTQETSAEIVYAQDPRLPNSAAIPAHITGTSELSLNQKMPIVKRDVPDVVLPEGQKPPPVAPGQYVADDSLTQPGVGDMDVNTQTINTETEYSKIELNTLTPDFFTVGGR